MDVIILHIVTQLQKDVRDVNINMSQMNAKLLERTIK